MRVSRGNIALVNKRGMATRNSEEAVALALRELSLSPADQEGLADFLTDFFGSPETDDLG